jgi:hypothetical protein
MIDNQDARITRISIDSNDPGYREDHGNFLVLLDGEMVRFVLTADEVAGEILCDLLDDEGDPVSRDGEWVLQKRTGRVEIRRIDE